jgi:hypothetical protein
MFVSVRFLPFGTGTAPALQKSIYSESMVPEFHIIPMATVHPTKINLYSQIQWEPYRPRKNPAIHLQGVSKDHAGKVSSVARRKINKAIEYLLFLANDSVLPDTAHGRSYKFKIAFITLTLPSPQVHTDKEIKDKCLNQFLVELRLRYKVKNYIWRAEKQKNGNIHFHILVDRFIPWSNLRDRWNRIINKLDYVENYRNAMRAYHSGGFKARADLIKFWDINSQLKAYQKGKANDWNSPNSTDIHAVHKIGNISAYLSKYYSKDEQSAELKGRLWGCNYELSDLKGARVVLDNSIQSELNEIVQLFNPRIYEGEYFQCIELSAQLLNKTSGKELFKAMSIYLQEKFNFNISTRIET